MVAVGNRGLQTEHHVQGADRSGRRVVGRLHQLVPGYQFSHRLQVRTGQHQKTIVAEYTFKFRQRCWHFIGIEMLDIVARVNGVHALALHGCHLGDAANHIRLDLGVDIQAELIPLRCIEPARGSVFVFGTATDM